MRLASKVVTLIHRLRPAEEVLPGSIEPFQRFQAPYGNVMKRQTVETVPSLRKQLHGHRADSRGVNERSEKQTEPVPGNASLNRNG